MRCVGSLLRRWRVWVHALTRAVWKPPHPLSYRSGVMLPSSKHLIAVDCSEQ